LDKRSPERGDTSKKEGWMKKRQTMGKMMRDRELRERRAMKQQKKDERKLAAAEGDGVVEGAEGTEGADDGPGAENVPERVADGSPSEAAAEPGRGAT
jgi:hypothetical protein